jgi:hypothetical protein
MSDRDRNGDSDVRDEDELEGEDPGVIGGGGPATTWRGGEHGEEDEHLEDTDHRAL